MGGSAICNTAKCESHILECLCNHWPHPSIWSEQNSSSYSNCRDPGKIFLSRIMQYMLTDTKQYVSILEGTVLAGCGTA